MNFAVLVFDPKYVQLGKERRWGNRTPDWLAKGLFEWQWDSVSYSIKAGDTVSLPEDVARHGVKRASFRQSFLTGDPVRPLTIQRVLPGGVQSELACPVCGDEQQNLAYLSQHILTHAEERGHKLVLPDGSVLAQADEDAPAPGVAE